MKFTTALLFLLPVVLATPVEVKASDELATRSASLDKKITDNIMFDISLAAFSKRRKNKNPKNLIWDSDNCTKSPDNPLGFPFVPGCQRHDFGYENFRKQNRFGDSEKLKIDKNFREDLYFQCNNKVKGTVNKVKCKALAEVYYYAVRRWGGKGKRALSFESRADSEADPYKISPDELKTEETQDTPTTEVGNSDEELEAAYKKALATYEALKSE